MVRLSKQRNANEPDERPYDHNNNNSNPDVGSWSVNKPATMHGHLARSLHTASDTRGSRSTESQSTRARSTLEESHREWEYKRQTLLNTMIRLRARLRAGNEVEDDFVLVDADPLMADTAVQFSQPEHTAVMNTKDTVENGTSLGVRASPNTQRQLVARQGTHSSNSNKARVRVKKKSPIAVKHRSRLCRSNSIPLETLNTSHGNTPTPGSIVTARSRESTASEGDADFTFVDWFIVVMFVVQSIIWISLGRLFVSVLGS